MTNHSMRCLERQGKARQHNRKTKQNLPKAVTFQIKNCCPWLGFEPTHETHILRRHSYQLSYRSSSVGWNESHILLLVVVVYMKKNISGGDRQAKRSLDSAVSSLLALISREYA